jgi:2-C-methyl-D-erythritol 4-phosphate cytidylyltransferase
MINTRNNDEKVWAIVPAAGTGTRMGSHLPKQYLPLLGKTVIEHTLQRLLKVEGVEGVVVALNARDQQFSRLPVANDKKIHTTIGGRERSDSVLSALESLQKKAKLSDWILVHDAARCCIHSAVIQTLLTTLASDDVGGILGVPASDTLKQVGEDQEILLTLNRSVIWQAQTPQLFRYGVLREALQSALQKKQTVTDEASAIELAGYKPKIVMGHHDNIKITHPEDLIIAETILRKQEAQK